jgi:hypothetical protein
MRFAIVPVAALTLAALLSGCNRDSAGPGANSPPPGAGTTSPPPATTPSPSPAMPPASGASG